MMWSISAGVAVDRAVEGRQGLLDIRRIDPPLPRGILQRHIALAAEIHAEAAEHGGGAGQGGGDLAHGRVASEQVVGWHAHDGSPC
jgi:hypothetical protein